MKKHMRSCLTCGVLFLLVPGCFTLYIFGTMYSTAHPERGEHQPHLAFGGGPPEATDFCWYRSYFFTAYEFSCTEEQFRRRAAKYPLAEIKEAKPFQMMRYNYPDTKPPLSVENDEEHKKYEEYRKTVNVTICRGLYATKRASNGGGYDVAYDRESQRGYFFTCPRQHDTKMRMITQWNDVCGSVKPISSSSLRFIGKRFFDHLRGWNGIHALRSVEG